MTDTLAIPFLIQKVKDRFTAESTNVPNLFGWKPIHRQGSAPRIIWVPGDDTNGSLGDVDAPRLPGRNPRPLANLHELVTVYISGADSTAPEDEDKQYIATRFLFDAWYRAIYRAMPGQISVKSAAWKIDKNERRRGAAIRVLLAVDAMIPDSAYAVAPADTNAEITPVLETPPVGDDPGREETDEGSPDVVTPGG